MKSSTVLAAMAVLAGTVAAQQTTTTSSQAAQTTSSSSSQSSQSSTSSTSAATRSSTSTQPVITGGDAATTISALPTATGGDNGALPTLTRTREAIPTYPPPAVPPTSNAPFMQQSTLPQGTVFIAVGAILGAFGLTVLVWRSVIACLLHRDVERAATAQHLANDKAASFPAPPAPFYKSYNDSGSNPNLLTSVAAGGGAAAAGSSASLGRGVRRTNRGPTPSATPSQSNLFFSPTAASGLGQGSGSVSHRDSRLLPSGFYAAGGSATPGGRHEHSISLSNLRPDSRGHARAISPEESPSFGPSRTATGMGVHRNVSTSTLNLNNAPGPGQRAPSAYLEDMLDDPNSHIHTLPGGHRPNSHFSGSPSPQPPHPYGHSSSPSGGRF